MEELMRYDGNEIVEMLYLISVFGKERWQRFFMSKGKLVKKYLQKYLRKKVAVGFLHYFCYNYYTLSRSASSEGACVRACPRRV